jgi:hypothetical protein
MSRDPIVDEVRAVRDRIARECEYDVKKLADALREEERISGRKVVCLEPRKMQPEQRPPEEESR